MRFLKKQKRFVPRRPRFQFLRRRKKLTLVVAFFFCGLLVSGLVFLIKLREPQDWSEFPQYQDDAHSFSFAYPEGWEVIGEENLKRKNEKFVAGVKKKGIESTACGVIVQEATPSAKFDVRIVIEYLDENLGSALESFGKISSREVNIADTTGVEYIYTFEYTEDNFVKQKQLVFKKNAQMIYLTCTAFKPDFDGFREDFEVFFESFALH